MYRIRDSNNPIRPNQGSIKSNRILRSSIGSVGHSGEARRRAVTVDDGYFKQVVDLGDNGDRFGSDTKFDAGRQSKVNQIDNQNVEGEGERLASARIKEEGEGEDWLPPESKTGEKKNNRYFLNHNHNLFFFITKHT